MDFNKLVLERYGDKVSISGIENLSDEIVGLYGQAWVYAAHEYPEKAWLREPKCPECDTELGGLFGVFTWGIQHGCGYCSHCGKVSFRFYHYPLEGSSHRFTGYAVIGIPKGDK